MFHIPFLNVSFGIFAFMPHGWLFMLFIIALECALCYVFLPKRDKNAPSPNKRAIVTSNVVSGVFGIWLSMLHNGGWWLVVWFPWVSDYEVKFTNMNQIMYFVIYYLIAFVLSVVIEFGVNYLFLKKYYLCKQIFLMTLYVNICSYVLGSIILYAVSFSDIPLF